MLCSHKKNKELFYIRKGKSFKIYHSEKLKGQNTMYRMQSFVNKG